MLSELDRVLERKKKEKKGTESVFTSAPMFSSQQPQRPPAQGSNGRDEDLRRMKALQAHRVALMAQILPALYPSSQLCKTVAVAQLAAAGKAGRPKDEEEESKEKEERGAERKSGVVDHEPDEQERRLEVLAKFLFVHNMLTRMQRGAEHVLLHPTSHHRAAAAAAAPPLSLPPP